MVGFELGGGHLSAALWRLPKETGQPATAWRLLESVTAHRGHRHADSLLQFVHNGLARHELAPSDIAVVAAGSGPGGFTGIRVGLATAIGLSVGTGAVVWPVCSLRALAQPGAGIRNGVVVPLIDARRGEVYGAAFEVKDGRVGRQLMPPMIGTCDAVMAATRDAGVTQPLVFGSGAVVYDVASEVPPSWHVASAAHLGWVAALAWEKAGRAAEAAPLVDPSYLRKSDAELSAEAREMQAREGNS